jgi:DNA-binding CsgD family transcriptional regulator
MREDERLSLLTGDIYDAALDASLWPGIMEKLAGFIGGAAATLHIRNSLQKSATPFYHSGVNPHYTQLYFDKYVKLDPMSAAYFCLDVGDVISNSEVVPHSELVEMRFYKEWAQPQGFVDNIVTLLDRSATNIAVFAVIRHERHGLTDDGARERMRLIIPHMRRAVLIGNVIDLKATEAAALADTLDGIAPGMFLVDESARIVHANAAGQALLVSGEILRAVGGRLVAGDAQADQTLLDIFIAAGSGDTAIGTKGIAVSLSVRDGEPHVAHVLPLTSGARRRAGIAYAAVAAVFVHKAALATPSPPEAIAKTFDLTPGELRVLLAVVTVGGVPETAAELGIAETTVKFHLRRLFEKTGARRQAELVKLVAGFANPIVG